MVHSAHQKVMARSAESVRCNLGPIDLRFTNQVKQRPVVRHVCDRDIVGNNVTIQPCLQRVAMLGLGVDEKAIAKRANKDVGVNLSLGIQNARFDRRLGRAFPNIVCNLAI